MIFNPRQRCLNSVARSATHGGQIGKQISRGRQVAQHLGSFLAKVQPTKTLLGLEPEEADDFLFPIHILGFKPGKVSLRCAQMPGQLVETTAFRVQFPGDDGGMFTGRDGTLLFIDRQAIACAAGALSATNSYRARSCAALSSLGGRN